MITEPALRFWLDYAEREGAVHDDSDPALVLLPAALQSAFGLPGELAVTAEPEVARDDGALLLIPGHPAVDGAAAAILEEGDVGWAQLAWPSSVQPSSSVLEARARQSFQVDHGRIDAAGEAASVYVPVLRVGALVTHGVSLDHRFREREEVWVDARDGSVLDEQARRRLEAWPRADGADTNRSCVVPDLAEALAHADAALRARADARLGALARQAEGERHDQLARADAYFEAALASIASRRATAAPKRQTLLDAQAESTRVERVRRLAEIEETFTAVCTVTPFRSHLLLVPALYLPVAVRRGPRTFPCSFTWMLPLAAFAPCRCPHCGGGEALVAGRQRLGCRACLPRRASPTP